DEGGERAVEGVELGGGGGEGGGERGGRQVIVAGDGEHGALAARLVEPGLHRGVDRRARGVRPRQIDEQGGLGEVAGEPGGGGEGGEAVLGLDHGDRRGGVEQAAQGGELALERGGDRRQRFAGA